MDPTTTALHDVLAVVLQVREGELRVLLWERAREPFSGCGRCPGGALGPDETLERSIRRHLAAKVDVREVAHLEQLVTLSDPAGTPPGGSSRPATSASSRTGSTRRFRTTPPGTRSTRLPGLAFDHRELVLAGRGRLRAKLSYTNIGFALAPPSSRSRSCARSTRPRSATTSRRRTSSACSCAAGCSRRPGSAALPGRAGGRPASVYRFRSRSLEVTDPFAVLRPPQAV